MTQIQEGFYWVRIRNETDVQVAYTFDGVSWDLIGEGWPVDSTDPTTPVTILAPRLNPPPLPPGP
jgi:hypothetical protein